MSKPSKAPPRKTHTSKRSGYVLHSFLNDDGSIDGEWLHHLFQTTPGVSFLLLAHAAIERQNPERTPITRRIINGICNLLIIGAQGDEIAQKQLQAIEKLIAPAKYELPLTKIQELIDKYETSPQLARGFELRRIMSLLSQLVEPLKANQPDGPIRLREDPDTFGLTVTSLATLTDHVRQRLKRNTTLQSLAIHFYLDDLQEQGITDEGVGITENSLKRDLREVSKWESKASDADKTRRGIRRGSSFNDFRITWYEYSEGWKERTKARKRKGVQKS